jgi:hypothetical protein
MLVDGVTINDGRDCPAGLCAAPICVDNSIAGMPSKTIEASRLVAMMANMNVERGAPRTAGVPSRPKSDT